MLAVPASIFSGCAVESPTPAAGQELRAELEATPRVDLRGRDNPTQDPAVVNVLWDSAQLRQAVPVPAAARARGPGSAPAPSAGPRLVIDPQPATAGTSSAVGVSESATGRLFFTLDAVPRTCTGSVLSSEEGGVVATAGHCLLSDGESGPRVRAQNLMFVPGYRGGAGLAGRWFAEDVAVAAGWEGNGDWSQDVGFVRLADRPFGESVHDFTGGLGAVFGEPGRVPVTVLGYPSTGRYDGQNVQRCSGDGTGPADSADPDALTAPCPMTAGYSGGPWLLASGAPGRLVGVSSHDYGAGVVYGARLGGGALEAFRRVEGLS